MNWRRQAPLLWLAVFGIFTVGSGFAALAILRPSADPERTTLVLVYAPRTTTFTEPPQIEIGDPGVSELIVRLFPSSVPAHVSLLISGAAHCAPLNDIDGVMLPLQGGPESALGFPREPVEPASTSTITVRSLDAQFLCRMQRGAAREAFSGRRFALAANPRFVNVESDDGCLAASAERACPVTTYRFTFSRLLDPPDLQVLGGREVREQPDARMITSNASRVRLRWRDETADHWREVLLFVLAGAFALGLSALLEAIKAVMEP
jgi:hypothetical protein